MDRTGSSLVVGNRRYRVVALGQLVKADWNYKKNEPELTKKLLANIRRNGQVENLVTRDLGHNRYEVINGNHRVDVLEELKAKRAIVCDMGKLSKRAAMRLAVELNETRFETDYVKLSKLVKEMKTDFTEDDLLSTLPFDARQLTDIDQITTFEWPEVKAGAKKLGSKNGDKEEGRVSMVLRFTAKQTNILNAFFARANKKTPEDAIMWAIEKV